MRGAWRQIGVLCGIVVALFGASLSHAQTNPSERANPEQIRANLKNILDSGEFQSARPAESTLLEKTVQWLREKWDWLMEQFQKLFRFSVGGIGKSPGVQWLFIFVFLVIGSWLAYRLIRSALASRQPKKAEQRTAFDLDESEEEIAREPDAWLQEADKWSSAGDYRRAYRALFLAILLQFDQAGILRYERSRTNGEYLRALRQAHHKALHDFLRPLIGEFDLRWYGEKPTTPDDVAAIRQHYAAIQTLMQDATTPAMDNNSATLAMEKA